MNQPTKPDAPTADDGRGPARTRAERWPRVNLPNRLVRPYTHRDRTGREWQKAIVNIPSGTEIDGVRLDGYSLDTFLNPHAAAQKLNGNDVTISFKPGDGVRLFKGRGEAQTTLDVTDPWRLCTAIRRSRDQWKTRHAADDPNAGQDPWQSVHGHLAALLEPARDAPTTQATDLARLTARTDPQGLERVAGHAAEAYIDGRWAPAATLDELTDITRTTARTAGAPADEPTIRQAAEQL
ncbi:spore coat protein, partial [Bifidobacterium margollesii]